jgi:hypothetical protein
MTIKFMAHLTYPDPSNPTADPSGPEDLIIKVVSLLIGYLCIHTAKEKNTINGLLIMLVINSP